MSNKFFFNSETPPLDDGPDGNIDLLNDETFGPGAVDDDWENEHKHFAEQHNQREKALDEDELELSNRQLAAAVEELVLNSDQDQDAIDPAIVSLRKESRPGSYDPRRTEDLISPYHGERNSFGQKTPPFASQASSSMFQTDGMRNIWSSTDAEVQDTLQFSKSPSLMLERQELNEKLRNMLRKTSHSPQFEDEAILSAVKAPPPTAGHWPPTQSQDLLQHLFPHKPPMLRAEDLEGEFLAHVRGPSPTFGISIPKDHNSESEGVDRSLPARSVSPIFGSPPPQALPIGTPPKHIADLMQHAQRHGMTMRHPMQHPNYPPHLQRPMGVPPQRYYVPPGGVIPPHGPWPLHMNRPPMNHAMAPGLLNRMGLAKPFPMMAGSPPANMSPVGSPRFVQAPHLIPRPNIGFGGNMMRGGPPGFHGPHRPPGPMPNQPGFRGMPPPPMYRGPGHLHPEHSRFVRMRRQQNNRNRHQGGHHGHQGYRHNGRDSRESYLMTNREKEWVVKIQMMALQSDRPEIDDYYYQHYIEKRLREGGLSLDDDGSEQKRLITPTKANPDNKKYVPVQFNNSLGKLTVSSAYNPRQTIDVVHAEKEEESTEAVDLKMSMNKRLEIYKVIEKAFVLIIEIEDLHSVLENHTEDPKRKKKEQKIRVQTKLLEDCLFESDETKEGSAMDNVSQILRIRKGKRLICRVLSLIAKDHAFTIILTLMRHLPSLLKRDQKEDVLQELYHPVCEILNDVDSDVLSQIGSTLIPCLHQMCKDKFGISIICKLLCIGHTHKDLQEKASDNGKSWDSFVFSATSALVAVTEKGKSAVPRLLDTDLGADLGAVLESHARSVDAEGLSPEGIKNMKTILIQSEKIDLESLGAKRFPSDL